MSAILTGKFVNVVGTANLTDGTGKILYVNPTSVVTAPEAAPAAVGAGNQPKLSDDFQLSIQDAAGKELKRISAAVLLPSETEDAGQPKSGLINENIPYIDGMHRIVLLYKGQKVSTHTGGDQTASGATLKMGASAPGSPEKRTMSLEGATAAAESGITYTVQVKPEGQESWHTIAVGRKTPDFVIDRNQFADSKTAKVRVIRTNGFEDQVVAEKNVDFGFGE